MKKKSIKIVSYDKNYYICAEINYKIHFCLWEYSTFGAHIVRHIRKKRNLVILVFETSTLSNSTKSKAVTLTFRRGLYSFIWWNR